LTTKTQMCNDAPMMLSCWTWFSISRSCRCLRPWIKFRVT